MNPIDEVIKNLQSWMTLAKIPACESVREPIADMTLYRMMLDDAHNTPSPNRPSVVGERMKTVSQLIDSVLFECLATVYHLEYRDEDAAEEDWDALLARLRGLIQGVLRQHDVEEQVVQL